jgi:hypothetical protein
LVWNCVADPHYFHADPDPAFHFYVDADPDLDHTSHSDADPDPPLNSMRIRSGSGSYHSSFADLDLTMLQSDPIRLPPFLYDANPDPDPAFHFVVDPDPDPASHCAAAPDPYLASQNDPDPDLQRWVGIVEVRFTYGGSPVGSIF